MTRRYETVAWRDRPGKKLAGTKADKIERFKAAILKVCREYDLSISHEDGHGSFLIEEYSSSCDAWFNAAPYSHLDECFYPKSKEK